MNIKISVTFIFLWVYIWNAYSQEKWSPEHVYYGKGGILTYTPDEQGNTIPDFSHVGYRYGDVPIPDIATVVEVSPVEGDDGATIQAAINSLYTVEPDENGFRGAVLLKSGIYQVAGQIRIAASGIVLRGEGNTDEGTVIIAEGTSQRDLIKIDNGSSRIVHTATKVDIKEDYVPVGRKFVVVSDASGYAEGDQIVLYRPGTYQWISDLKMNQIPPRSDGLPVSQWSPSSYNFYFERLVTKVSGDTLFFRNPVVMAIETKYGGGAVFKFTFNRLENIGVENLCLKSAYAFNTDENHSWRAIAFYSVENSWVRKVTSWYFSFGCVDLAKNSRLITVDDCHVREPKSVITGSRRYSFYLSGSLHLFKNLTSDDARHDYASNAYVTGPSVFTNCSATKTHSDIGPHHRWAMGTLYEKIVSDGQINVQDRDNMGSGHGWAGANHVFWNCIGSSSVCQSPWVSAKNYNFGFIGAKSAGARHGRPDGEWIGHNVPDIFPSSLYEAQLNERLNGVKVFCAMSMLTPVNDTAYLMRFTLPLVPEQLNSAYFTVTGSVPIDQDAFTVTPNDEYSVIISSSEFKRLPNLATVTVKSESLTSLEGLPIQGMISSSYTLPDKRPFIDGVAKIADNVYGFGEASSSKPGFIYMIKYGVKAETCEELDSLVEINQGRKVAVDEAGVLVQVMAKGLPGGYYEYYAVDEQNYVSEPSTAWVIVDAKGPVTSVGPEMAKSNFKAYRNNNLVVVDPEQDKMYSLNIYTSTGRLIYQGINLTGIQTVNPGNSPGILILRININNEVSVVKLP